MESENIMDIPEKRLYVVLEHLTMPDKGRRFWTTASNNNTHSIRGELWYKEIAFTDSPTEAERLSQSIELPSEKFEELHKILLTMDIPEKRLKDFRWLSRNLGIRNKQHPDFEKAVNYIKQIIHEIGFI